MASRVFKPKTPAIPAAPMAAKANPARTPANSAKPWLRRRLSLSRRSWRASAVGGAVLLMSVSPTSWRGCGACPCGLERRSEAKRFERSEATGAAKATLPLPRPANLTTQLFLRRPESVCAANNSGSLAIFAAILRASSLLSNLAAPVLPQSTHRPAPVRHGRGRHNRRIV
jgi:hypothetical protein